jgi:hypothetical protein
MYLFPDLLQIGPFIIPVPFFLLGAIGLLSSYLIFLKSKELQVSFQLWRDSILNALISFALVWKFSFLLLDPMSLFYDFRKMLISDGGTLGIFLGLISSLYITYRHLQKSSFSIFIFIDLTAYWLLISCTIYWFIQRDYGLPTTLSWGISYPDSIQKYHPITLYKALLLSTLLLYTVFIKKLPFGKGRLASYLCIFAGVILLFISNFEFHSITYFGFAMVQWLYIGLMGLSVIIYFFRKRWLD